MFFFISFLSSFSCLALLLNFVNNPSISLEHVTLFFNKSHIFYQQFFTFSVNHVTSPLSPLPAYLIIIKECGHLTVFKVVHYALKVYCI